MGERVRAWLTGRHEFRVLAEVDPIRAAPLGGRPVSGTTCVEFTHVGSRGCGGCRPAATPRRECGVLRTCHHSGCSCSVSPAPCRCWCCGAAEGRLPSMSPHSSICCSAPRCPSGSWRWPRRWRLRRWCGSWECAEISARPHAPTGLGAAAAAIVVDSVAARGRLGPDGLPGSLPGLRPVAVCVDPVEQPYS